MWTQVRRWGRSVFLMTLIGCSCPPQAGVDGELECRSQMVDLSGRLGRYCQDLGEYPTTDQGLIALLAGPEDPSDLWEGPYWSAGVETECMIPLDPWGNEYRYERVTPERFSLWSSGADGVSGTDDDIVLDRSLSSLPVLD